MTIISSAIITMNTYMIRGKLTQLKNYCFLNFLFLYEGAFPKKSTILSTSIFLIRKINQACLIIANIKHYFSRLKYLYFFNINISFYLILYDTFSRNFYFNSVGFLSYMYFELWHFTLKVSDTNKIRLIHVEVNWGWKCSDQECQGAKLR